ncbi:MAG TPA: beta-1,6-N-acetylglucosaminyltransferase [Puia sp.]|nr:beta-1,6-N-acetylglucosaminyltransferase [Puia sp.]
MRIACLIMAHKDPLQVERLIKKFEHEGFDFYIHLDKKSDKSEFKYLENLKRVYFIKNRIKVRWASFSFVKAIVTSMKEVLNSGRHYDFISLMSGQDYPIKPISAIYSFLKNNQEKNFICFEEQGEWWNHAIDRIKKYHFTNFDFKGRYRVQFMVNAILPRRKFPLPYMLYGGPRAMCMTLTPACARYVVNFIEENRRLRKFAYFTWGPDEFLIPTIIMNSQFKNSVINNNFYYIDWSKGGSNPKTLTVEDFELLAKTDKLLARKFDIAEDAAILDLIDEMTVEMTLA